MTDLNRSAGRAVGTVEGVGVGLDPVVPEIHDAIHAAVKRDSDFLVALRTVVASSSATLSSRSEQQSPPRSAALAAPPLRQPAKTNATTDAVKGEPSSPRMTAPGSQSNVQLGLEDRVARPFLVDSSHQESQSCPARIGKSGA